MRPSLLTPELMEEVVDRISEGKTLREVADSPDMPALRSLQRYLAKDPQFDDMVQRALERAACLLVQEAVTIADEEIPDKDNAQATRNRLRSEIRLKAAEKLNPKRFGQRAAQAPEAPPPAQEIDNFELARGLAFLLQKGDLPASVLTPKPTANDSLEIARGLAFLTEKGENLLPSDESKVH